MPNVDRGLSETRWKALSVTWSYASAAGGACTCWSSLASFTLRADSIGLVSPLVPAYPPPMLDIGPPGACSGAFADTLPSRLLHSLVTVEGSDVENAGFPPRSP